MTHHKKGVLLHGLLVNHHCMQTMCISVCLCRIVYCFDQEITEGIALQDMDITAVIPFASLITGRNQCTKYYQFYLQYRPVYAYFKVHLKACNNVDG